MLLLYVFIHIEFYHIEFLPSEKTFIEGIVVTLVVRLPGRRHTFVSGAELQHYCTYIDIILYLFILHGLVVAFDSVIDMS